MTAHRPPLEQTHLRVGFIPLLDSATLIVARERGFAEREGLRLELVREISWANIRDRVIVGHLDAAQMLAGLPIASTLGIQHLKVPMVAPMTLGLGGNAITVSSSLYRSMDETGRLGAGAGPSQTGAALAQVVRQGRSAALPPLTLAMVYPVSSHNYELRYWLAASGIDPDRDVRLVVIPPSLMVDALVAGRIDGFCVGEPWNSLAEAAGVGRIVATKAELWPLSPDKVLGMRTDWAEHHPNTVAALVRALHGAARWSDDPDNHPALAELLAQPAHIDAPVACCRRALSGRLGADPVTGYHDVPDFIRFHRHAATFPWQSHALWLYAQMVRWGQVAHAADAAALARATYRPDLYRSALSDGEALIPLADSRIIGAAEAPIEIATAAGALVLPPDRLFDGTVFDPDRLDAYLTEVAMADRRLSSA